MIPTDINENSVELHQPQPKPRVPRIVVSEEDGDGGVSGKCHGLDEGVESTGCSHGGGGRGAGNFLFDGVPNCLFSAVPYNWGMGSSNAMMMPRCGSISPGVPSCLDPDFNSERRGHTNNDNHQHQQLSSNNKNNNTENTPDQQPHYVSPTLPIHPRTELHSIRTPMPMPPPFERTDSIEIYRPTDPKTPILVPLGASYPSNDPEFIVMIDLPLLSSLVRHSPTAPSSTSPEGEGTCECEDVWSHIGNGFEM